jgi:twitching motility two-component system response regulator PilG
LRLCGKPYLTLVANLHPQNLIFGEMSKVMLNRPQSTSKKNASRTISGFTVSRLLQAIELKKKNCTLELRANGKRGRLYIQNGAIIHAITDVLRGEEAAIAILGWENAQIKLVHTNKKIKRIIQSSLTQLIINASQNKKGELKEVKASSNSLQNAIHLVEGNHFKAAHAELSAYLKTYPNDSIAWLWYSRCMGNQKAIFETLDKCIRLVPGSPKIIEEIQKLELSYQHVRTNRIRRCPFCWSPLDADALQCYYCKSGLNISTALKAYTQQQANSKFLISSVTRYMDVFARENNAKAIFLLSLANCNLNKVEEALDLLTDISRLNPGNNFFSEQLNIVVNHLATRITDYTGHQRSLATRPEEIGRTERAVRTQKKKILVVEDSRTTRKVIVLTLKPKGYAIVEARDGLEALGKISEERPDLILLDIILPGMDGHRILAIIRKTPELRHTPVIMLTSKSGMVNKVKSKLKGSTGYLTKPFEPYDLIDTVQKHIG